jgi:oligopeptide transport system substrate-binding protein
LKTLSLLALLCCCSPQPAELVVVNGSELDSFDPQLATSAASARLLSAVFDCLTAIDPATGDLRAELATSWTASDSNRQWRFRLRSDARWSDGSALTLIDVRDSWKRLQRPSTAAPYADWLAGAKIEIVDGALQVNFGTPQPLFAIYCAYHALAPIPEQLRDSAPGVLPDSMVYSGHYTIAERHIRDFSRLEINPQHPDFSERSFKTIDFLSVDSQWTALNLYLDEQVDFIPAVPQLAVAKLQQQYPQSLDVSPSFASYFIRLQQQDGSLLSNKNLRKALAHSIDREQLVALIGGERQAAYAFIPTLLDRYTSRIAIKYDAVEARQALAIAKTELNLDAISIDYLYPASEMNRVIAEFLQQQWHSVLGIKVSLNQLEAKSFFPLQSAGDYQASHSTWIGDYYDPYTFLELFRSEHRNNRSFFSNANYDKLLDDAQHCVDQQLRLEILSAAEELLLSEYALIPLCFDSNMQLLRPSISGHTANKFGIIEWHNLSREPQHD